MANFALIHTRKRNLAREIIKNRWIYLMMLPVVLYFVMFKYIPIGYLRMAFYDYKILRGFVGSDFVGLEYL